MKIYSIVGTKVRGGLLKRLAFRILEGSVISGENDMGNGEHVDLYVGKTPVIFVSK